MRSWWILVVCCLTASPLAAQTSVQSGPWSNPATWGGVVPTAGPAEVAAGHIVELDSTTAVLSRLDIRGTLRVSRTVSSQLRTLSQVQIHPGGTFDQGTEADPIQWPVRHRTTFVLRQGQAFVGGANYSADPGIWNQGVWTTGGHPVLRTWGKLAANASAADTLVVLDGDARDWPVGGEIVISQTSWPGPKARNDTDMYVETETRTIAAIVGDGDQTHITVTPPLQFAHAGTGLERGEVGLLTRNVVIESELTGATNIRADVTERRFACARSYEGGKMFLAYTQFFRMGSYGVNGCFALHWHRLGETARGQYARGVSFLETGFRSTNVHESVGVLVEDTVSAFSGNGIVHWVQTDSFYPARVPSVQRDHMFAHNLVTAHQPHPDGAAGAGETFREAAAFWPGVADYESFVGNVAAGASPDKRGTVGFTFAAGNGAQPSEAVGTVPRTFVANEAHALSNAGMVAIGQRVKMLPVDLVGSHSWNSGYIGALSGGYHYPLKWHRTRLVGNPTGFHAHAHAVQLQDSVIIGRGPSATRFGANRTYGSYDTGADVGILLDRNSRRPFEPHRFQRVAITDLTPGLNGEVGVGMLWPLQNLSPACEGQVFAPSTECSTPWVRKAGVTVGPNIQPVLYRWAPNVNDALFDFDAKAVYFRKDLNPPRGEVAPRLFVSGATVMDAATDALKTPLSALPASLVWNGLATEPARSAYRFTAPLVHNEPPSVSLAISVTNRILTMRATPSADATRVEYFVDHVKVGETRAAPHVVTVDLLRPLPGDTLPERRYAYPYARAFDGVVVDAGCDDAVCRDGYEQRGYSQVYELGPEVLISAGGFASPPAAATVGELRAELAALHAYVTTVEAALQEAQSRLTNQNALLPALRAEVAAIQAKIAVARQALQ